MSKNYIFMSFLALLFCLTISPILTERAVDCERRDNSLEWVKDNVNTIGYCRSKTVAQWIAKTKTNEVLTCSELIECPVNLYSDGKGNCNKKLAECYHSEGCITPSHLRLKGNCKKRDWDIQSSSVCSMHETGSGCSQEGYVTQMNWVIDSKGVKRFVDSLQLVSYQKNMSAFYTNTRLERKGPITGDQEYCDLRGLSSSCYAKYSTDRSQWRVQDQDQFGLRLNMQHCMEEIYCYGKEDVLIFPFSKEAVKTTCTDCTMTCDSHSITITVPDVGNKILRICGRQDCWTEVTEEKIHQMNRNFYHKIYDEKVVAYITNENRDVSYELSSKCPTSEICLAIDCEMCYIRWINVKCYSWYHTIMALLVFYITFGFLSLTIIFFKPVFKALRWLSIMIFRIVKKVVGMCRDKGGRMANRVKRFAEDADLNEVVEVRANPPRFLAAPRRVFITIILLLPLCLAKAPCSNIVVDNVKTETCKRVGSQLMCVVSTMIDLPLVSYDQASCLHFIDNNYHIMGELQITPLDLSFKCAQRSMFYTRDVKLIGDGLVRCPHAGPCNDEWCGTVDDDTEVEGLSEIQWPVHQTCKPSPACAGNGCFYCTNACSISRYYPKPTSTKIYHVFDCLKWEPSGIFHFLWTGTTQDSETNINLVHGETRDINSEIKATLHFTVQSETPVLTKTFMSDGERVAVVSTSPPGIPSPGTIGHVQCGSSSMAATLDKKCAMAPNACICQGAAVCDCAQVHLEKAFNPQTLLPLTIGNDYLSSIRGVPNLKTSAFGSASIKIHAVGKLAAIEKKVEECHIAVKSVDGCHSCLIGATVNYTCKSMSESVVILRCGSTTNLQIECDAIGKTKSTRLQHNYPIVDLVCSTACSKKDVIVSGTLKAVGLQVINEGSHIQLMPANSLMDYGSWLTGAWFSLGWLNTIWIGGVIILLLLSANFFLSIVRSKMKTN